MSAPEESVGALEIWRKMTWSKPLFVLFLVALFWSVSLFVVPFTLAPGTVAGLNGYANSVDFAPLWDTLPPYQKVIYYVGDAQCHQISSRTIYLNGNEMPVDARDVSIYVFGTVGLLGMMFIAPHPDTAETFMRAFPRRFREAVRRTMGYKWFVPIFIVLALLPVALDGGVQLLTDYESDNIRRVLTGVSTGLMTGILLGSLLVSMKQFGIHRREMEERLRREHAGARTQTELKSE